MNRVTRGTAVLAVALTALSCKGDPTDSLRNGVDHLVATPSALFLAPGETSSILIEAVDEQGNRLGASFNLGTVGAGIAVAEDDSFNLVFDKNGNQVKPKNWPRALYNVTMNANSTNSAFVVSAGGKSLTVAVRAIPDTTTPVTLNSAAPNLGDTSIATAPANFKFTPASVVSISGASVVTLGISADSSTISFLVGPSANNTVSVSNLVVAYAPSLGGYSATSGGVALSTPAVTSFVATYSSSTPALNDTVTLSSTGFKFLPTAAVTVGGRTATVVSVAADSLSLGFVPVPGTAGAVSVNGIVLSFLTAVPLNLPATVGITVPGGLAGTDAFATAPTIPVPGVGATVVFLDAGGYFPVTECNNDLGGDCRLYKIVVPAGQTIGMTITWQGTTDIGVYTYDNAQSLDPTLILCDSKGAGAAGQPETCSAAFTAGTYFLAVDSFSPFYAPPNNVDPTDIKIVLTGS